MKNFHFFDDVGVLIQGREKIGGVQANVWPDFSFVKIWSRTRGNFMKLQVAGLTDTVKRLVLNKE